MEISREEYERLTAFEREARPMLARLGAELEATGKIIVAIGEFGVKFSELFDELDKVVTEHHGDGEESTVPGCEWDGATVRNITRFVPLQFTIDIDQDDTHTVLECYPDRFVLDGEEISGDEVVSTLKAAATKLDALDPRKKDPPCPVCNKPPYNKYRIFFNDGLAATANADRFEKRDGLLTFYYCDEFVLEMRLEELKTFGITEKVAS